MCCRAWPFPCRSSPVTRVDLTPSSCCDAKYGGWRTSYFAGILLTAGDAQLLEEIRSRKRLLPTLLDTRVSSWGIQLVPRRLGTQGQLWSERLENWWEQWNSILTTSTRAKLPHGIVIVSAHKAGNRRLRYPLCHSRCRPHSNPRARGPARAPAFGSLLCHVAGRLAPLPRGRNIPRARPIPGFPLASAHRARVRRVGSGRHSQAPQKGSRRTRWGNGPRPAFLGSVVVPQNDGVSRNGVGLTLAPSIIGDDHGAVCRY